MKQLLFSCLFIVFFCRGAVLGRRLPYKLAEGLYKMRNVAKTYRLSRFAYADVLRSENFFGLIYSVIYQKGSQSKIGVRFEHSVDVRGVEMKMICDILIGYGLVVVLLNISDNASGKNCSFGIARSLVLLFLPYNAYNYRLQKR